ncbi:CRISPR-associated helicase Cas3' [Williamsia sp. CHRR-6]|uniref:CRISPR-associated helicase Cas3' n=1 Tax=Williamsia sp. CHRR-6 TaxID=2835871 RepID=UPI001BDAA70E|nr:CRISPR-associated helicase Cas3' [Williamsia sp. CHRR-6]MBT0566996.1 CRISPR-associated helicase Cas3' [Williamsia sp. CHRR-6]
MSGSGGDAVLSRQVLSAWAKSDRDSDGWLSLVRHSEDTVEVAGFLWDDWLPPATRRTLSGSMSAEQGRALAQFLAGVHDVGKLSPAFAMQVDALCGPMRDAGLDFPALSVRRGVVPHAAVSFLAVQTYLTDIGASQDVAQSYACVVGGHHGVAPARAVVGMSAVSQYERHHGTGTWARARAELIDHVVDRIEAREALATVWAFTPLTVEQQILWTGFVIMADWIASNTDLFPLSGEGSVEGRGDAGWEKLDLPAPWQADPPANLADLLRQRFGLPTDAVPNAMQSAVVEAATAMTEPGLIVVEATMGSGKTEAALAAAEHLATKFGLGGVMIALPTMATSNAMFARVRTWLTHQAAESTLSLRLAHGKAHLNNDFRALGSRSGIAHVEVDGREAAQDDCRAEVIAHQWFQGRKRSMLSSFVVGTIDQLLFAGLKAKHVVLRHLALANKVVIVDEVHAADDYMRTYLLQVLEWLGAYRVPVIMLSATLPGEQRSQLVKAYERGRGIGSSDGVEISGDIGYPVVTTVSTQRTVTPVASGIGSRVSIERIGDEFDELVHLLQEALTEGGCVAVVRNTVRRAQECARVLRSEFGDDVVLLHSRFVAKHRADLERHLVDRLGRGGDRPERLIVVATQVIEQSLDVDFDLLVTDLAPIDLLFQRVGRLHRHQRERPPALRKPRIVLTGVIDWAAAPPDIGAGHANVYGAALLLRAAAVLEGRTSLALPTDIPVLVQSAYAPEFPKPEGWETEMTLADSAYGRRVSNQRERASTWTLRRPSFEPVLIDWLDANVVDADTPRGYARVRDSDEGIEVLITRRVGDEVYLLPQCGGERIEVFSEPSSAQARRILNSSVPLPRQMCSPGRPGERAVIDKTIEELEQKMYPGWEGSRWLAGELVVQLDENNRATVGDFELRYDDLEGLVVTKGG